MTNRIGHLLGTSETTAAAPTTTVAAAVFSLSREDNPHAVFVPLHYEPNYAYPLVVWLHGPGDDERQLKRIMPLVSMRNYVAIAPRGTVLGEESDERVGFSWCQDLDHITLAEHRVMHAIETAKKRFNIAPTRVFLAGFECGGTMALRLAMEHPSQFAGVLSFGGGFPRGNAPLRRLNEVRRLCIMLASGRDSRNYSPEEVCQDLRLFYSAGMAVDLRHYPCGDDLTTQMLSDMDRWIMQQFCQSPAASPVEEASQRRSDEGTSESEENG